MAAVKNPDEEARRWVNAVIDAIDLPKMIGGVVRLEPHGKALRGTCPFCGGTNFQVSPSRRIWKCFGCPQGGDAWSWVMATERVTFREAGKRIVEELAKEGYELRDGRLTRVHEGGTSGIQGD